MGQRRDRVRVVRTNRVGVLQEHQRETGGPLDRRSVLQEHQPETGSEPLERRSVLQEHDWDGDASI